MTGGAKAVEGVAAAIERLASAMRREAAAPLCVVVGWWVLAQGERYAGMDFAERDRARDRLLSTVTRVGVQMGSYVWVWDEADRVQLVLATMPTLGQARLMAERLRRKGLCIRVKREEP